MGKMFAIKEAARFFNVSEISLMRWTVASKLKCYRLGGNYGQNGLCKSKFLAVTISTTLEATIKCNITRQKIWQIFLI